MAPNNPHVVFAGQPSDQSSRANLLIPRVCGIEQWDAASSIEGCQTMQQAVVQRDAKIRD